MGRPHRRAHPRSAAAVACWRSAAAPACCCIGWRRGASTTPAIDFSPTAIARVQDGVTARGLDQRHAARRRGGHAIDADADLGAVRCRGHQLGRAVFPRRRLSGTRADAGGRRLDARAAPSSSATSRSLPLLEAFHTSVELAHAPASMSAARAAAAHPASASSTTRNWSSRRTSSRRCVRWCRRSRAHRHPGQTRPPAQRDDALPLRRRPADERQRRRPARRHAPDGVTAMALVPVTLRGLSLGGHRALIVAAGGRSRSSGSGDPARAPAVSPRAASVARTAATADLAALRRRSAIALPAAAGLDPADLVAVGQDSRLARRSPAVGATAPPASMTRAFRPAWSAARFAPPPLVSGRAAPAREYVHQAKADRGADRPRRSSSTCERACRLTWCRARSSWLDALPLTPNGKIDRKALPEPDRQRQERRVDLRRAGRRISSASSPRPGRSCSRLDRVGLHDNVLRHRRELAADGAGACRAARLGCRCRCRSSISSASRPSARWRAFLTERCGTDAQRASDSEAARADAHGRVEPAPAGTPGRSHTVSWSVEPLTDAINDVRTFTGIRDRRRRHVGALSGRRESGRSSGATSPRGR